MRWLHDYEDTPGEEIYRRRVMMELQSSTFFKGAGTHYDPIFTPLFVSLGFTGTITIGSATISTAALLSGLATTALTIGVQLALAPKPPKASSGKVPLTQEVPYRIWAVGTTRVSGAMMLWEASGSKLCSVQAMVAHRMHQYRRFWLHDDVVTLNPDNTVHVLSDDRYGGNLISIWSRLGAATETAYSDIVGVLSSQGIWTNNHRGDGQASLGMICVNPKQKDFSKRYPYGAPRLTAEGDWALVWDYRDPEQSPEDPSTWIFSKNAALVMCWHQCFNEFGHKRDYRVAILPLLGMWQEEADVSDEDVPIAGGGTEKRYEVSGWDTTENAPKVGTNAILAACDGWICERPDGALLFTVGKFRESRCGLIDEQDICGKDIDYGVLPEDECNRMVAKVTYPATDYTTTDVDFEEDVDAQLIAGRVLAKEMDLQWVTSWRQGRRLLIREWKRQQILPEGAGSIDLWLSGINSIFYRWNRVSAPTMLPKLDGKIVENQKSLIALTKGGFTMNIAVHPDDIDYLPDGYEGQMPPVPSKPNAAGMDAPVISNAAAIANGGTVYLRVTINDPNDDSLTPAVHYRLVDDGTGNPGAWIEQRFDDITPASGSIVMSTSPVPVNNLVEVEAAFINSKGDYSEWSATDEVNTNADPVKPGTPVDIQTTVTSPDVAVSARAANDNTRYLVFKRGTTTQSFAAATSLGTFQATGNQVISITDTPAAGTWVYWVGALNVSSVPSDAQVSATVTV